MEKSLRNEAAAAYTKINQRWLKLHYHVLLMCVAMSAFFEVVIYFVIKFTGTMYDSNWQYWLKYIIVPIVFNLILACISFFVIKNKRLKMLPKQYMISFLLVVLAASLSFFHGGYEGILFCFLLPILMSIMYENQRITGLTFLFSIPLEIFTALTTIWDPYKEVTHGSEINLLILVILSIVTWMVSYYMIKFSLIKKEIIIARDVERQQLKERIMLDELTNVGNKNALNLRLQKLENTACEYHLAMMDIDDFKQINDQYGHLFGDEVLRCFGTALNHMRRECSVYRYGGDEFSIIIMDNDSNQAMKDIQKLQNDFVETLRQSKRTILMSITVSVGLACKRGKKDYLTLLKQADTALYDSKKKSKNAITFYKE